MKKSIALLLLSISSFASTSHAYLSLLSTGEILEQNQFQVMGYIESVFNKYDGTNLNARGSLGLAEDLQADIEIGVGEFDVMLGAFAKWVPIPDVNDQPAVGVRAGLSYLNWDDFSQTSIVAMPFVSKGFETNWGKFNPFTGIPFGINSNDDDTYFMARIAFGTEWTHDDNKQLHAIGEIAFDLSKSFSSINAGASYDF